MQEGGSRGSRSSPCESSKSGHNKISQPGSQGNPAVRRPRAPSGTRAGLLPKPRGRLVQPLIARDRSSQPRKRPSSPFARAGAKVRRRPKRSAGPAARSPKWRVCAPISPRSGSGGPWRHCSRMHPAALCCARHSSSMLACGSDPRCCIIPATTPPAHLQAPSGEPQHSLTRPFTHRCKLLRHEPGTEQHP